jgi:hypothetical protein
MRVELYMVRLTYTILSSVSSTISCIQTKHISILRHRHKAWFLGSKGSGIIQRILKKGLRLKVSDSTSPHGSLGGEKHRN